ncbi:MAG: glycosyltransferase [Nonlabens sp.]
MKKFTSSTGKVLLYKGTPDQSRLEELADGPGDIWHSGLDQGLTHAFQDLKYQAAVFWWYINDFPNCDQSISWRMPHDEFVVREEIWNLSGKLDQNYIEELMQGLDYGYRMLRYAGAVVLHVKGLFASKNHQLEGNDHDLIYFYKKFFKKEHLLFMSYRKGWNDTLGKIGLLASLKPSFYDQESELVPLRPLEPMDGTPTVTYIIPTMLRHDMCVNLLNDLAAQTYHPTQVVIVDATPVEKHTVDFTAMELPFKVVVQQQISKGSCKARNEALELSTGEFVIFGDDDIRMESTFVENHIRFLQTYNADACNGLDIMADHSEQDLSDLAVKKARLSASFFRAGVSQSFNNANSCVRRKWIDKIGFNDVNYDGGYGEDNDYGLRLAKAGATVLYNPYSVNLHLKPPVGGYRFWGSQAKVTGKKRKKQPWELDDPVTDVVPVPSPTMKYFQLKHFTPEQNEEFREIYFIKQATKNGAAGMLHMMRNKSYRKKQYAESMKYAKALLKLGERY